MHAIALFLLLSGSVFAADIESVKVGVNTLLVTGSGLSNVTRATLARRPVGVMPLSDSQAVLYCQCQRWPTGTFRLRLFKPHGKLKVDVTITGLEQSEQPPVLESERPQPAG